ncbi:MULTISPECIES: type I secretion system permease/ATPase [unclassified Pseudomonas]|uniref:type I secretion system permease/ATPase n=1 Tax=unclassified Pseudomonas TaxID=196821 RepID=UPI00119BB371|nr:MULTISPECIES: type I secretion system permease/ATPase [unclassified Pseudomonas]TWC16121.1 ATP-binding cassette subfamily C protein LapB [Pseudomonas sp. SJZ075]TWC21695.1 ATP-binding cassette subfamily C protein LapB [Pseudomonas sp. SJZ074]TWC32252.1 ATP-binding cassette subfamily C protein LapB [Pseudomonas sp. SJZ078]TWC39430.1 ATP-binding cassette subfamily C protein LapB [Pseudomonas sp. SJZ085]TWC53244.1 ATP-binding cassette subfamily C protein LapB [Pseudomonas sp. SJZ124]
MTSMEPAIPGADPRLSFDDPLLDGLLILCKLHGATVSRASLSAGLPMAHQRLSLDLLPRAAARAGLQARVLRRGLGEISPLNLPVMLLLAGGRCAVLRRWHEDGRALILPCEADGGEQWVSREELSADYAGQALFARPRHELEDLRSPLVPRVEAWFRDTLKLSRWLYSDAILASLLINLLGLMVPLFVMQTYDRVVPNQATSTLWVLAVGLLIGTGFELVLRVVRAHLLDSAGKKTDVILSATLFERITGMAMKVRPVTIGGFAQSIHDFQGLREFLTAVTLTSLIDLPFAVLMLLVIGLLGGWLVVIPVVAFPITVIFALIIQVRLRDTVQKSLALGAQRQALLIETLGGLETLKACSAESERQHQWESTHGALTRLDSHARNLSALATNGTLFLQQLAGMTTIVAGVYSIIAGNLSVGALVASYMLGSRVLAPLGQIAGLITRYQQAQLTMRSTDALMALPQERDARQRPLDRTQLQGALDVHGVTFHYNDQSTPALSNASFQLKAGERVGIIGRSGSGKSTLARLVMGFYEPQEGQLLLDGLDLRQLDVADLRQQIGYVAHDLPLLAGSLRDNLTLGARYISDARMLEVAELTGVGELARQHPQGFDRPVGERGQLLSGGQRQAVLLARALLLDPPILLLDEPTSAMDNSSEDTLRQKLHTHIQGKTLLLVTHRTSMLSLVDRLVVLDSGRIVADGPKEVVIEALRKGRVGSGTA